MAELTSKYIGNLVTLRPIKDTMFLNVCDNMDSVITGLPTLIVGWKFVKDIYQDKCPLILDKKINDKTWWTFDRYERRSDFEVDYNIFYRNVLDNIMSKLTYEYFDVMSASYSDIKDLISVVKSDKLKYCYVFEGSFIYLLCDNVVTGISLDILSYMGYQKKKIVSKFLDNKNNIMFKDIDFMPIQLKRIIGENNIIIPYLFSIK